MPKIEKTEKALLDGILLQLTMLNKQIETLIETIQSLTREIHTYFAEKKLHQKSPF